jgi:hypothetical protein
MDPSSKSASGIELSPPGIEPAQPAANSGEMPPGQPEQAPANAEKAPSPRQPAAAVPTLSTIPLPIPQSAVPQPAAAATVTPATPVTIEDDGDLIEKAWVEKAKQIVERTRNDPHKQSEELTVFKADYMKKRYGKTIKISQ